MTALPGESLPNIPFLVTLFRRNNGSSQQKSVSKKEMFGSVPRGR